jgi:hypothetical protein
MKSPLFERAFLCAGIRYLIVPTLRVVTQRLTLRVSLGTQSVLKGIPTRSVGTIITANRDLGAG